MSLFLFVFSVDFKSEHFTELWMALFPLNKRFYHSSFSHKESLLECIINKSMRMPLNGPEILSSIIQNGAMHWHIHIYSICGWWACSQLMSHYKSGNSNGWNSMRKTHSTERTECGNSLKLSFYFDRNAKWNVQVVLKTYGVRLYECAHTHTRALGVCIKQILNICMSTVIIWLCDAFEHITVVHLYAIRCLWFTREINCDECVSEGDRETVTEQMK